jgi:hypothetical protein
MWTAIQGLHCQVLDTSWDWSFKYEQLLKAMNIAHGFLVVYEVVGHRLREQKHRKGQEGAARDGPLVCNWPKAARLRTVGAVPGYFRASSPFASRTQHGPLLVALGGAHHSIRSQN